MKVRLGICILFSVPVLSGAQTGGTGTYTFLNLPATARIASLGGKMIAVQDKDLNLSFTNPSLLVSENAGDIALNYVSYFAGIKYGYAAYALPSKPWGNLATGIQFINYGKFTEADETGTITGEFKASEYAIYFMWSKKLDSMLSLGVTLKPVFSVLERYSSLGIATDMGLTYFNPEAGFTASLGIRNLGTQITTYQGEYESLPFEIMLGVSQRLKHAPFRFFFLLQNLEHYQMYTEDEDDSDSDTQYTVDNPDTRLGMFAENMMRHLIVGAEIIPLEQLYFRLGYNYQRRRELQLPTRIGAVGFSWGFGLKLSRFEISYGRARYHLAGASNHFTLTTELEKFLPRKQFISD